MLQVRASRDFRFHGLRLHTFQPAVGGFLRTPGRALPSFPQYSGHLLRSPHHPVFLPEWCLLPSSLTQSPLPAVPTVTQVTHLHPLACYKDFPRGTGSTSAVITSQFITTAWQCHGLMSQHLWGSETSSPPAQVTAKALYLHAVTTFAIVS